MRDLSPGLSPHGNQVKITAYRCGGFVVRAPVPIMNPSKYSQETLDRIKSNAEAAKRRLARLNAEYLARQKARKSQPTSKTTSETFGEAVARIEQESRSAA